MKGNFATTATHIKHVFVDEISNRSTNFGDIREKWVLRNTLVKFASQSMQNWLVEFGWQLPMLRHITDGMQELLTSTYSLNATRHEVGLTAARVLILFVYKWYEGLVYERIGRLPEKDG